MEAGMEMTKAISGDCGESVEPHDFITWDRCDTCRVRRRVVMMHHNGTPVLACCVRCTPDHFKYIAALYPYNPVGLG
jgi:hypothetical protein